MRKFCFCSTESEFLKSNSLFSTESPNILCFSKFCRIRIIRYIPTTDGAFVKKVIFGYFSLFDTSGNLDWHFWTYTINCNYVEGPKSWISPNYFNICNLSLSYLYFTRVWRSVGPSLSQLKVSPKLWNKKWYKNIVSQ